jgi:hypothetical protein
MNSRCGCFECRGPEARRRMDRIVDAPEMIGTDGAVPFLGLDGIDLVLVLRAHGPKSQF